MTDKIAGRTLKEWADSLYAEADPQQWDNVRRGSFGRWLAELVAAVREEAWNDGHAAGFSDRDSKPETRPCPTCKGLGYQLRTSMDEGTEEGPCTEKLCREGKVPRDYAVAYDILEALHSLDHVDPDGNGPILIWLRERHGWKEEPDASV